MSIKIQLWFSSTPIPELQRTSFQHPLLTESIHAMRGRATGAIRGIGTFPWAPAVQALSILLLGAKRIAMVQTAAESASIAGEAGSHAATLDSALAKQTDWIASIFGVDTSGNCIARRLFSRVNPERKHPGPVTVSFRPMVADHAEIEIYLDDVLVTCSATIEALAVQIGEGWKRREAKRGSIRPVISESPPDRRGSIVPFPLSDQRHTALDRLKVSVVHEVQSMLRRTNIFDSQGVASLLDTMTKNALMKKILKSPAKLVSPIDSGLNGSHRLGVGEDSVIRAALCREHPIKVSIPPALISSLVLFTYLRVVKGYNIDISFNHVHTTEIMMRILNNSFDDRPDLCQLSAAAAATLVAKGKAVDYKPLMFLPSVSHRVVAPRSARAGQQTLDGHYLIMQDVPSGSSFYFSDLVESGCLSKSRVKLEQQEPDRVSSSFSSSDAELRSILWFPHYTLNVLFNDCVLVDNEVPVENQKESILFAHESFLGDRHLARCLNIALRDAWIELLSTPVTISRVVDELFRNTQFLRLLFRSSGLHHFKAVPSDIFNSLHPTAAPTANVVHG